jgi:hypothetical protein
MVRYFRAKKIFFSDFFADFERFTLKIESLPLRCFNIILLDSVKSIRQVKLNSKERKKEMNYRFSKSLSFRVSGKSRLIKINPDW